MIFGLLLLLQFGFDIPTGVLSIEHPDTRAIVIIGDYQREVASGDTLHLPEGDLQLRFGFPSYRDVLVTVHIRPDQPASVKLDPKPIRSERERGLYSVYPAVIWDANLIVETDPRSRLRLNGQPLDSHVVSLQLEPGSYSLEAIDAYGRQRSKKVKITSTRLTYVDMTEPQYQSRLKRASFIPGLAQYHKNEVIKSVLFASGVATLAYWSYSETTRHARASDRYDQTRTAYLNVIGPDDLVILAERGIRQAHYLNDARRRRHIAWTTLGLAYAWSVMDGRRPGPSGFRTDPPRIRPFIHPDEVGLRINL